MPEKPLNERIAMIETHVSYIRKKVDCFATKRELNFLRWVVGGLFGAILAIASRVII